MKRHNLSSSLRTLFLAAGMSLIVGGVTYWALNFRRTLIAGYTTRVRTAVTVTPTVTPVTKFPPTAVRIAKIKKELPVQAALVNGNEWDMFDKAVAWLSTSAVPGEGNVILYAHNRKSLWLDLYKLRPGDAVEVQQNGIWLAYEVTQSRAVTSKDVDAILSEENQLTMYTCEGSFDQKRRVVYAKPL